MSYCKYQRCVEMKVLDNSFSRIVHISGEILKFTLCTDIYSTVNKNVGFFFNFLLKKKKVLPAEGIWYVVSRISFPIDFWVLTNSHIC